MSLSKFWRKQGAEVRAAGLAKLAGGKPHYSRVKGGRSKLWVREQISLIVPALSPSPSFFCFCWVIDKDVGRPYSVMSRNILQLCFLYPCNAQNISLSLYSNMIQNVSEYLYQSINLHSLLNQKGIVKNKNQRDSITWPYMNTHTLGSCNNMYTLKWDYVNNNVHVIIYCIQ